MTRDDLLGLSLEALTALTNPGFVKRGVKDLAAGRTPVIEVSPDETVVARFDDGHVASLPVGVPVRQATCTCPASGLCRHRVTLVLAYQASPPEPVEGPPALPRPPTTFPELVEGHHPIPILWTPAEITDADLSLAVAPATLAAATRLARGRPVVRLNPGGTDQVPSAVLPTSTVRFFARGNAAHARCDCRIGTGCEHLALAVWAFRQARADDLGIDAGTEIVVQLRPIGEDREQVEIFDAQARQVRAELAGLARRLWFDGCVQPYALWDALIAAVRGRAADRGWRWVVATLDDLELLLAAHQSRSTRFDPIELLQVVAELTLRVDAAAHAESQRRAGQAPALPASDILGVGVAGEVALDHLRLVSLGVQCWRSDSREGARIALIDPDTLAISAVERDWPLDPAAVSAATTGTGTTDLGILAKRLAGSTMRQLASGQVVTAGARRSATGLIEIAASARQTNVVPLAPQSWDLLRPPIRQPDAAALAAWLQSSRPDVVQPKQQIEHLHVLPIDDPDLDESPADSLSGWDAATQSLEVLLSSGGEIVRLSLPHTASAPHAVDTLERALSGTWGRITAVSGLASLSGGTVVILPLAIATEQRIVVLQAEPADVAAQPPRRTLAPADEDSVQTLVTEIEHELASWLRVGLRHVSSPTRDRMRRRADLLHEAGLHETGDLLRTILDELQASDSTDLIDHLATATQLLAGLHRAV